MNEKQIPNGRYTIVYNGGAYRTLRFKAGKNNYEGKTIASLGNGDEYEGFGFLMPDNKIRFWKKFRESNPPERLTRIERAVNVVASDPGSASQLYAMKTGKCSRCGRDLRVPASLHRGLGPECAGKGRWKKEDQQEAFDYQRVQAEGRERLGEQFNESDYPKVA